MSRYAYERLGHTVVVGWDPPLQTYFAQVYAPEPTGPCTDPQCELRTFGDEPEHALADCRDNDPIIWLGAGRKRYTTIGDLADDLGTYGAVALEHAQDLEDDKAANRA